MKKVIVSLIISAFIVLSCKTSKDVAKVKETQEINYIPYYLKVYEADSLYLINDFEGSYRILDSLFKVYKPLNTEEFIEYGTYLNCCVMTGNIEDFSSKVVYAFLNFGNFKTLHKDRAKLYDSVIKVSKIEPNLIKDLKKRYYDGLNIDLRAQLLKMLKEDDSIRSGNFGYEEMDIIDDRNRIKINEIFKKYSFPKRDLIGSTNAYDVPDRGNVFLNILFLHQSDSVKKKYLPILLDGVKRGYCDPKVYSQVYDRMMMDNLGKQYYGSYMCDSNGEICNLINSKKIDSIRKSIGLYHIKYNSWKLNKILEN